MKLGLVVKISLKILEFHKFYQNQNHKLNLLKNWTQTRPEDSTKAFEMSKLEWKVLFKRKN
jgi:hypothetical protein